MDTLKFNQSLRDDFFQVNHHVLDWPSDEGLTSLMRELERKPITRPKALQTDPGSRKKRLDEALAEADHNTEARRPRRKSQRWLAGRPFRRTRSLRRAGRHRSGHVVLEEPVNTRFTLFCLVALAAGEVAHADHRGCRKTKLGLRPVRVYHVLHLTGRPTELDDIRSALPEPAHGGRSILELRNAAATCGLRLDAVVLPKRRSAISGPTLLFVKQRKEGHFMVVRPVGHTGGTTGTRRRYESPPFSTPTGFSRPRPGPAWP